jgi:formylglycine-generating enzyme required for sulfatase activity
MPSGDDSVRVDKNPVVLKKGEQYTLVVVKRGYTPYRKKYFAAAWSGPKEKSVALEKRVMLVEKGIGPQEGKPWIADLEDSVTMEFMLVPTGHFMMGSDAGEDDERPVHRVEFHRPYWIAKTEVTNQFEQFKTQEIVQEPNKVVMPRGAIYPVTYVTWTEAMDFCARLTRKERRRGRLPEGYVYTLPTEAEWEYACRSANRFYHVPDYQLNYLGCRPVVLWNPPAVAPRATSRLNVEVE